MRNRLFFASLLVSLGALPALGAAPDDAAPRPDAPDDRSPRVALAPPVMLIPGGKDEVRPPLLPRVIEPLTGEPVNGFPNWQERVTHEWINRARANPQADLAGCGANCPENTGSCYTPQVPLIWNANAGRSARYHSAEMGRQSFFDHPSHCTLVGNISSLYPGSCDGSASCACVGGTSVCNPACTDWTARLSAFGVGAAGEIIAAGYSDADSAFYGWLWEFSASPSCSYYQNLNPPYDTNGHRWLILKATNAVGAGYESVSGSPYVRYYTGDFGDANAPIPKIPSGAHYPQQSSAIDFWANWYDAAGPRSAAVDVDGACTAMSLGRGSPANGAYHANVTGLGSGCHRYYFTFVDSNGITVTYPTTGSYGIGTTACADWDVTRPASCVPPPPSAAKFYTLAPCRILDTRDPVGPLGGPVLLGGSALRHFGVASTCGVPVTATAVSVNVTVTGPVGSGDLRIFPAGQLAPATSIINFAAGQTRANNALVGLSGTGEIGVVSDGAPTHFILDVNGYLR